MLILNEQIHDLFLLFIIISEDISVADVVLKQFACDAYSVTAPTLIKISFTYRSGIPA